MTTSAPARTTRPPREEGQWARGRPDPLNHNEQVKLDDDALNVRARIEHRYAANGFASITPDDLRGRFRWMGLYTQRKPGLDGGKTATLEPHELDDEYFMMRVRIDGGQLSLPQLRAIADVSTTYYARLEQGRARPSVAVLAAVARVLHLDDDQRDHVFALAGTRGGRPRRRLAERVQPQLRRLLDNLTMIPGIVLGRSTDILAWNPLAAALLTDFGKVPEKDRNYTRILFTDPAMKSLYADWEYAARSVAAHLRLRAAKFPDDPRLALLIGELSMRSPEFRRWWAAQPVPARTMGAKAFRHPVVGPLTLDWSLLNCGTEAGQELLVGTAEPGTPSHEGLQILSSWNATTTGCAEARPHHQ